MQLIDGKKISDEILAGVRESVASLPFTPLFCDVLVGDDFASRKYVEMKAKKAESVGMKFYRADFAEGITTDELVSAIDKLNKLENMCGIIVQLPLPAHIDEQKVLDAINPSLDVDALGTVVNERFYAIDDAKVDSLKLPTALACVHILDSLNINLADKNIAVLGQGKLVGKPVTRLLKARGLNPAAISSSTENSGDILKNADIIISGIGKGHYLKGEMVKDGVIIIDAGTSESGALLIGDVDSDSVKDKASFLSPCPGGVGPVTVAMLINNVLEVAKNRK